MSCRNVKWEEMFPDEMAQAIAEHPLLYLPYGMCEPHGHHNALGLDGIKCYEICVRAAQEGGGVVGPLNMWHIGDQGVGIPWLARQNAPQPYITALGYELFAQAMVWHLRAAVARGFRAVIAMTGHYGGTECDMRSVAAVFREYVPLPIWALADWECMGYKQYKLATTPARARPRSSGRCARTWWTSRASRPTRTASASSLRTCSPARPRAWRASASCARRSTTWSRAATACLRPRPRAWMTPAPRARARSAPT